MDELLLGVDYGERNTGLAFGRSGLTSSLEVVDSKNEDVLVAEIARAAAENKISKIIMGLPTTEDGKETQQSEKVRRFAKLVKIRIKLPVEFVSEYGTTHEAIETAIRSGISQKGRQSNDSYSAELILKRYFREKEEEQQIT